MVADKLIAYLETLTVTQGRLAGEPLPIFPWERRFIRGAFAEGVIDSALTVGRGNGKTTLVAALACAAIDGPLAMPRAETVVVASSFDQSKITFNHVLAFLKVKHGDEMEDKSLWRVQDSANRAHITNRANGATLKCIGSDPRRAHGLAPVLVLADEGAQWPETTAEAMMAALRTALGKLPDARLIALGTRPSDEMHWFGRMLAGGADYCQSHAAKRESPKFQRRTWAKANPSLRYMPDLERVIRRESEKAKFDPSLMASFEALRLNLGTSDVVRQVLLDVDLWRSIEGDADADGRPYWGIDLGTSAAQSAVCSYWPKTGRLEALAAFPAEPGLKERGLKDGVAELYQHCYNRGELIQCGGAAVSVVDLIQEARDRFGQPVGIASDRWRESELRDALKASGIPVTKLELRGMGYKDGAEDVRAFRRWCLEGKVTPVKSLLLTSAIAEARTVADTAGNAKLAKGAEGGRRLRARDDAAAAAILGVGIAARQPKRSGGIYLGMA